MANGGPELQRPAPGPAPAPTAPGRPPWLLPLATLAGLLSLISNLSGIASGDDGVGYTAIADSLLGGHGLGYFLEDPVTVWPPLWPSLMAAVARVTPLDTIGAAMVLNALTVFLVVVVGYRLLARTVVDAHLVAVGTAVMALGPVTMGFGHLLMTDLAFAVVVMAWMLALIHHRAADAGRRWLLAASVLVWLGFTLRYVALYLLALGGLWLLLDGRRRVTRRLLDAVLYGVAGTLVPLTWMLRNHAVDGTWTGPRSPSARGPIDNAYDIVGTMGRWILPGALDRRGYLWAGVGLVVTGMCAYLGWKVLTAPPRRDRTDRWWRRLLAWLARPSGLLAVSAFGYLAYIWYVRSTTALNKLDLRLLNPAYFSLLALALVLADRTRVLTHDGDDRWHRRSLAVVHAWASVNVVVGVAAAIAFAAGWGFFAGNYQSDAFEEIRADPVLAEIPAGCSVYSNLPNALYPAVESLWSPRRTYLESDAPTDDLARLDVVMTDGEACLVWLDIEPHYGHLWSREQLARTIGLVELGRSDGITVYRFGR